METWSFADRLWPKPLLLETGTKLHTLKRKIQQRHGAITNIRLWRDRVRPENALVGDLKTLEECGFEGSFLPSSLDTSAPATEGDADGEEAVKNGGEGQDGADQEATADSAGEQQAAASGTDGETKGDDDEDDSDGLPEVIALIYDFVPRDLGDPLLLISPR